MEATTLFTLSFLFLSFTTIGVDASHGISIVDDHQPLEVLDSSGNKLQKGEYYYIQPLLAWPYLYNAAIVSVIYHPGTTWLQLEIETFFFGIEGLPVTFSPTNLTEDASIHVSTDLNIKLYPNEVIPVLGESPVWKVPEGLGAPPFVTLGGAEGDISSCFKIEKASEIDDRTYKLVSSSGGDVGISNRSGGTKRLALADEALSFSFLPAKDGLAASK
ncbi:cysteine protease inhibitor WSCP [Morus notabilis]|uniref:cysteine protease inhibitor WSCP n=1 Tax=Morus notabilis TaxID=981085 RepID=UPI000CED2F21|nr:cysteine protease inhibitor WSCP [Morus notabilis]